MTERAHTHSAKVESKKSWIQTTFYKRECVKFLPASRDHHRCFPVCHVCQNLVRCCCGRLIGEHSELDSSSWLPLSGEEEAWCVVQHTKTGPTDAFGSIDFQHSNKSSCRAKYVRLSCDAKPEEIRHLMLREWNMAQPKLLISVHGGTDNFSLPPRVGQAFSKGLIRAAETAGAWIFTDGFNTGVSMYVGDAVKLYGTHERRKRTVIGITPWGLIENHTDLIGRDVLRHYQTLGNPLSKRSSLNGMHSHFLLVDDGTLGKAGGQQELRRKLERHIQRQRIHPRLGQRVPLVCVVVEGGPAVLSIVLDYVSRSPPVPVIVFEGTGRAADLLSLIHKQTAADRELDVNIKEDFLKRIENLFGVARAKAHQLFTVLKHCMDHRDVITIFDSESEDHLEADVAILTASLRGAPAEKLNITLAWDRADIAQQHVLVYGHHWKVGALEHAMLNALLMDRVSFVKLLIENGVTMKHFLTVSRLEELYNMQHQGSLDHFLRHIIEDAKKLVFCLFFVCLQCRLPGKYKISLIDIGMVIEYLIGGAYRSTYRKKSFKAVYNRIHTELKEVSEERSASRRTCTEQPRTSQPQPQFHRTADPYKRKTKSESEPNEVEAAEEEQGNTSPFVYSFNDLFVWAVLKRRQQMALFLWQHGMQALARAVVACRLYQAMASEAKESSMHASIADELRKYSLEFGQLAVDLLDKAFKENERMAMKLLTWEMTDWSNFTCLQMAVASGHRPLVTHSCTQMLLTDLWMGRLNMRKNSWLKIIVSILLPVGIQLLEFKSEAEMSHVPQSHEALHFGRDAGSLGEPEDVMQADESDAERGRSHVRHRANPVAWWLPWCRKVYDFYSAPVVKFWVHTMFYLTFLALFSFTVLVRMEPSPSVPEWLVISYISSTAIDKIREVWVSEPRQFKKKLKMWFSEYWNMNDFVAIILFFMGMALRWFTGLIHTTGRIIYCLDIIFWFVRLLDLLAINQKAGPYLTMISNMLKNMLYIVVIMGIVLLSFGTPRWSILNPHEEPSWDLLKQVLFQPYFMMFGEVYAGEINPCEEDPDCPSGSFLNPPLQAVYLFMQYIIMVNLLIAFYNNVYIHMKTISNQLWRYNRYRYIMTYHKKPFLPPPLIILSHMAACVNTVWQKRRRTSTQDRGSGLKLFLAPDDLKKLLDFEERCVAGYFREKHKSQHCSELNRIRLAADKAEEMMGTLAEVSEKVQFIQESLQTLDAHLGQLQDLSALAVDTLNLLSASENRQQKAVHLCPSPRITVMSCSPTPGNVTPSHIPPSPKANFSNPPSLRRGIVHGKSCNSLELSQESSGSCFDSKLKWVLGNLEAEHSNPRQRLGGDSSVGFRLSHGSLSNLLSDLHGSPGQSCGSSLTTVWDHEPQQVLSQEESMEEDDYDDDDVFIDTRSKKDSELGIVNPAFCDDHDLDIPRQSHFGRKQPFTTERKLGHSRSLSSSVETLAVPKKRHSVSGEPIPLHPGQKDRGLYRILERKRSFGRKCVKIKEGEATDRRLERDLSRRSKRKGKGIAGRKFRSSVSLSQLNFDHVDFLQKSGALGQNTRSPSQSVWSSWARSVSRRSSVQSWAAVERRPSVFKSTEDLDPHYSAMERNNLMRLAHTIPFTPVSLLGGEEVYVYNLEESEPDSMLSSSSSWCQRGRAAVLQPVTEQGVLDGGLRRAQWVLCTWAEEDVLRPGCVYVVKSFREEVVDTRQAEFPTNTTLHLCLRDIQQQRAAQKLMQVFNQVKPSSMPHSPRFLDVCLLWWQAKGQWLTIEKSMNGDFRKYNNNTGEEIMPSCGLEETVLAFSHWTYEYTGKELLVLDLQGVGVELTEPSVIRAADKSSSRDLVFGSTTWDDDPVQNFVLKHTCNLCCEKLGLTDLRKSSHLHELVSEVQVSTG
ncbi:transient receptor potential cation channel subfamily M member 6 isoform X1 [Clarias gariepinus]|uniref:transient receptor potential cation channel subfamily M member 6 isoform X1 n=1 Tax=Clarias gariepinus TaxID=13013 RepID=UPI00234DE094|nr:transient receptor potential cation channel subfamily M member 6 isoform X1 [Clarias gariepinus]